MPNHIHHQKILGKRYMRDKDFVALQIWNCLYSWLAGSVESLLKIIFPQNVKGSAPLSWLLWKFWYRSFTWDLFLCSKLLRASLYPQRLMRMLVSLFIHVDGYSTWWNLSIYRLDYFNSGKLLCYLFDNFLSTIFFILFFLELLLFECWISQIDLLILKIFHHQLFFKLFFNCSFCFPPALVLNFFF